MKTRLSFFRSPLFDRGYLLRRSAIERRDLDLVAAIVLFQYDIGARHPAGRRSTGPPRVAHAHFRQVTVLADQDRRLVVAAVVVAAAARAAADPSSPGGGSDADAERRDDAVPADQFPPRHDGSVFLLHDGWRRKEQSQSGREVRSLIESGARPVLAPLVIPERGVPRPRHRFDVRPLGG